MPKEQYTLAIFFLLWVFSLGVTEGSTNPKCIKLRANSTSTLFKCTHGYYRACSRRSSLSLCPWKDRVTCPQWIIRRTRLVCCQKSNTRCNSVNSRSGRYTILVCRLISAGECAPENAHSSDGYPALYPTATPTVKAETANWGTSTTTASYTTGTTTMVTGTKTTHKSYVAQTEPTRDLYTSTRSKIPTTLQTNLTSYKTKEEKRTTRRGVGYAPKRQSTKNVTATGATTQQETITTVIPKVGDSVTPVRDIIIGVVVGVVLLLVVVAVIIVILWKIFRKDNKPRVVSAKHTIPHPVRPDDSNNDNINRVMSSGSGAASNVNRNRLDTINSSNRNTGNQTSVTYYNARAKPNTTPYTSATARSQVVPNSAIYVLPQDSISTSAHYEDAISSRFNQTPRKEPKHEYIEIFENEYAELNLSQMNNDIHAYTTLT